MMGHTELSKNFDFENSFLVNHFPFLNKNPVVCSFIFLVIINNNFPIEMFDTSFFGLSGYGIQCMLTIFTWFG